MYWIPACFSFRISRMIGTAGSASNGHCIALNNIGNFLSSNNYRERSKFLVDFSDNENENIISSEGCFACDMNKSNHRTKSRSGSLKSRDLGRRGRRLRNRRNLIQRKRRHKRNNHNLMTENTLTIKSQHLKKQRQKRSSNSNENRDLNHNSLDNTSWIRDTSLHNLSTTSLEHLKDPIERTSNEHLNSPFNTTSQVARIAIRLSQEETRRNR